MNMNAVRLSSNYLHVIINNSIFTLLFMWLCIVIIGMIETRHKHETITLIR